MTYLVCAPRMRVGFRRKRTTDSNYHFRLGASFVEGMGEG